jgi:DpnII restriction endonuclease
MIPKEKAKEILERQIEEINELKKKPRFSPEFKKWIRDTEVAIEHIFTPTSRHIADFTKIRYTAVAFSSEQDYDRAYWQGLANARSILESMIEEIDEYGLPEPEGSSIDMISLIEQVCTRFHIVARQLRSRYKDRPTLEVEDEYDVQNLLHTLLAIHFDDIRHEEWAPSYAGGASRMDFLLKKEGIVIEAKKTRKGLGAKELGEQLIIDIAKYRQHPDCRCLVCFAYDPEGRIANPKGIENDLNGEHEGLKVIVIIAPKGT